MEKAIIGKKVGMTQIFDEAGKVIPVTVIEAGPCVVTQKKTVEKDGYTAVQLGFEDVPERKLTKPELGHLKKAGVSAKRVLKEFDLNNAESLNIGDEIKADAFAAGDRVDVTGISKGKGYAGVIKRHGAHRLKESHGTGPVHRHAGSMGPATDPVKVDPELNLIAVCGAIPGPKGGVVYLRSSVINVKEKGAGADISKNPQKASGRNPQKASARNK